MKDESVNTKPSLKTEQEDAAVRKVERLSSSF
jgi:hypothetical protein